MLLNGVDDYVTYTYSGEHTNAETVTAIELSPNGSGYRPKTRRWRKVPNSPRENNAHPPRRNTSRKATAWTGRIGKKGSHS